MGVFTYEFEVVTAIPLSKMFKACFLDGFNLILKIHPQTLKKVEYIEGNGEPGSIVKFTFGEGSQFDYKIEKLKALDKDNFVYINSVIEGDFLMNRFEKITVEIKLEPSPVGGSICKTTSKYYPIGDFEIKEEGIKPFNEMYMGFFKVLEAYLLANPDAY